MKNFTQLRKFDLESAKNGDFLTRCGGVSAGKPLWKYVAGPDPRGMYIVKKLCDGGYIQPSPESAFFMAPLGWVEDKPVYRGDILYHAGLKPFTPSIGKFFAAHGGYDEDYVPTTLFCHHVQTDKFTDQLIEFRPDMLTWTLPEEKRANLTFGQALEALHDGMLVSRAGWNGKGMWLVYVPSSVAELKEGTPYCKAFKSMLYSSTQVRINARIDMHTASGEMQPGWTASQTDMNASDWQIVG